MLTQPYRLPLVCPRCLFRYVLTPATRDTTGSKVRYHRCKVKGCGNRWRTVEPHTTMKVSTT